VITNTDCWDEATHSAISQYASKFLWRFIQHNAKENTADEVMGNITNLSRRDIQTLANIRFLLSDEVKLFLNEGAPRIINRLTKESVNEKAIGRSKIKGKIDWPRTYNIRAVAGGDKSLFVYSRRSQVFDLPENRLFVFLVHQIHNIAKSISPDDFSSLTWYATSTKGEKWINRITLIAAQSARLLRNPYVAQIGKLHELSNKIIEQTKQARAPHYRSLADIAYLFLLCLHNPIIFLQKNLGGNILEPLNWDTLFEVAVLFKIITTAMSCGWKETDSGLIGGGSKASCILRASNCTLRVFYQKLPNLFKKNSSYSALMTKYGFGETVRRPDIILFFESEGSKTYYIVEVKRSTNRNYLVDGTYKLLGYLKDFQAVREENQTLKGFLIAWGGIPPIGYEEQDEVQLFTWKSINGALEKLLALP
jgi:hypothetical protein